MVIDSIIANDLCILILTNESDLNFVSLLCNVTRRPMIKLRFDTFIIQVYSSAANTVEQVQNKKTIRFFHNQQEWIIYKIQHTTAWKHDTHKKNYTKLTFNNEGLGGGGGGMIFPPLG